MIRPLSRDSSSCFHMLKKMAASCEVSSVGSVDSETTQVQRGAQLYLNTKNNRATGLPMNVFLPEEETFSLWKAAIRSSIAEIESVPLADVVVDKLYVVNKSSKTLKLTCLVGDAGVTAASLEYPLRQKNGRRSTLLNLACDWHEKGKLCR